MGQVVNQSKKSCWTRQRLLQIAAILFAVLISGLIFLFRDRIAALGGFGYLGAFLVPLLCCATIIFPIPGLIIVFTLGAVLNPLLVGLISGVGGTIGETTGYLLGYGGRAAIDNIGLYRRIENWMKHWAPVTLFVLALIPNPIFDIAGAAAGALRIPLWKFLVYSGAGRIIKHTIFAFAGTWGLEYVLRFLK
jgi:membrane protein YqaA with SNARE-associated domain